MIKLTKKKTLLEQEIEIVHESMRKLEVSSKEYKLAMNHLSTLYELKSSEKKNQITPDTMAAVIGNLLGILIIVKHEELNVITSKALGFVLRGRA